MLCDSVDKFFSQLVDRFCSACFDVPEQQQFGFLNEVAHGLCVVSEEFRVRKQPSRRRGYYGRN